MPPNSAVSFPSFKKYMKEFYLWIMNDKNHSALHLNKMSSMRVYGSCNYHFTVLHIFTKEDKNKEFPVSPVC